MDILTFILAVVAAFIIGGRYGWGLRERMAERRLHELLESVEDDEQEAKIPIVVEKHSEVFFIYNKETNQFLAQGKNIEELSKLLHNRFPGKRFECSKEHLEMMTNS